MLYFHETSIFYWDLLSKLNFIQAGLHPSRITVAVPHPTNAHEYSRWVLGDLEPSSRFAVPSCPSSLSALSLSLYCLL